MKKERNQNNSRILLLGLKGIVLLSLILTVGCRMPWQKQEKPVPQGRIIKDALSLYEMGRTLELNGNYTAARAKYLESLGISPRPKTYLALGEIEMRLRQFPESREHLTKALELTPTNNRTKDAVQRLDAIEDLIRKGEEVPESLWQLPPPPELSSAESAKAKQESQTTPGSGEEKARGPQEGLSHAGLEMPDAVESDLGKPRLPDITSYEETASTETLSEAEESQIKEITEQTLQLFEEEKFQEAEAQLRSALVDRPKEGRLHYYLGFACQSQNKPRTAVEAYKAAVDSGYRTSSVYYNTGICYEDLGASELALKAYLKAIETGGVPDAFYTLGMLREKRGELKEALEAFENYIKVAPNGAYAADASIHIDRIKRRR